MDEIWKCGVFILAEKVTSRSCCFQHVYSTDVSVIWDTFKVVFHNQYKTQCSLVFFF